MLPPFFLPNPLFSKISGKQSKQKKKKSMHPLQDGGKVPGTHADEVGACVFSSFVTVEKKNKGKNVVSSKLMMSHDRRWGFEMVHVGGIFGILDPVARLFSFWTQNRRRRLIQIVWRAVTGQAGRPGPLNSKSVDVEQMDCWICLT